MLTIGAATGHNYVKAFEATKSTSSNCIRYLNFPMVKKYLSPDEAKVTLWDGRRAMDQPV